MPTHLLSVLVSSLPKSFTFHHLHEAVGVDIHQCVGSVGEHLAKELVFYNVHTIGVHIIELYIYIDIYIIALC